jgi:hypothetical protein
MASILFLNIWLLMNDISVSIGVSSSKYKCSPKARRTREQLAELTASRGS